MQKHFRLSAQELQPLAQEHGFCVASDLITVEGHPVGYMYRDEPEEPSDSGWRFFSGEESDAYLDNTKHFSLVDVNLIANCDPAIIPYLDAPVGAEFDRGENDVFLDGNSDD